MNKKKVLLTATVQSHIAQFHLPLIEMLKANGYEVHVAAKNNLAEKNGLKLESPDKIFDITFERSPLSKNNLNAYKQLKSIFSETQYDIIHCNTPMGGVVTRLAAKELRKNGTKVFYTAHGFHFYKGAPLKNWLFYYPIEKWLTKYTDKLITISKEDFNLAIKKNFKTKVEHIHGVGVNTQKYSILNSSLNNDIRFKEGFNLNDFICICTGELNKNKNQVTVIKAVPKIISSIPNFKLILAGNGPLKSDLQNFIERNNLGLYVKMIGYRTDLERFVTISDIAVSASIREGLGLNIIEAMHSGKPIIASKNRGHNELVIPRENGLLVNATNSDEFANAIIEIYSNKTLQNKMKKNSLKLASKYTQENVLNKLNEIYKM